MITKLKWIKHRRKDIWSVPKFPFFTLVVRKSWIYNDRFIFDYNDYPFLLKDQRTYKTLQEAQIACEENMLKSVLNYQKEIDYTVFTYTTWCNNTGCGKYLQKEHNSNNLKYKKYQWLFAGHNVISQIGREPSLRFDISLSKEEVIKHAIKIHIRHCQRFINLMQTK